jgi:hypothetical protein
LASKTTTPWILAGRPAEYHLIDQPPVENQSGPTVRAIENFFAGRAGMVNKKD